ncbi:MAG TPA: DUF4124 domain-containing protein [Methylotenera sp.]|nr:DUF4124 domain-containing protein [Methylotenera sp.]
MNTKSFAKSVLFSSLCALGINAAFAGTIYKCTSASGTVSYSGTPCTSGTTTTSTTTTKPTTSTTTTSTTPTTTTSSPTTTSSTSSTSTSSYATMATTSTSTTTTKLVTDAVFASTSFWYKPIPTSVTLHWNSANFVKEFIRQKVKYYNNVNINTNSYSSPVYIATSSTPTKKVGFYDCQKKGWTDATLMSMLSAVPIPSVAKQASGTDGELTVYQPSTNTLWELWVAKKDAYGRWTACWGGKLPGTAYSQGIFSKNYGTTASGLPFIGGQITAEELSRGEIKHVIGISLVEIEKFSIYSWPANRSDGYNPNNVPNRIAEGQRFRLNPSVNVDALPMTRAGKIIAKAAQKYGFVVWDKAGSVGIRAQNVDSYTMLGKPNPYPALYGYKQSYQVLAGFPWDKLQFLPMNYGRP